MTFIYFVIIKLNKNEKLTQQFLNGNGTYFKSYKNEANI